MARRRIPRNFVPLNQDNIIFGSRIFCNFISAVVVDNQIFRMWRVSI
jgi:hypothetical protein